MSALKDGKVPGDQSPGWGRGWVLASKGMGTVLGPLALAWWAGSALDRLFQLQKPWASLVLWVLGAMTGLYGLVKMASHDKHNS